MDTNRHERNFGLRRQSVATPALSGGRKAIELPVAFGWLKAMSRFACHRSPRRAGLWLGLALLFLVAGHAYAQRERIAFNDGWRFTKGDPENIGSSLTYTNLKAWILPSGNAFRATNSFSRPTGVWAAVSFAQPDFNDSSWRKLNLPHDWGIEGPFQQDYPGETGKLPWWGVAWYRKQFTLPASDAGRRIVDRKSTRLNSSHRL